MNQPKEVFLRDYQAPAFLVEQVHLTFALFSDHVLVTQVGAYRRAPGSNAPDLVLVGRKLELVRLLLNGQETAPEQDTETLTLAQVPDSFTLELVTKIQPKQNTSLEGLYFSGGKYCTQCEPEGFRRITYFLDQPDVLTRFQVRIEADNHLPILLSNGNRGASGPLPQGRHFVEWQDPHPKPSYLFALVAGDLVCNRGHFITASGRNVTLEIWVEAHNLSKTDHALACVKQSMKWDEEAFGREYDLDLFMIVAVDDFNMGAMENKGLNIFNSSCVLADPETATDGEFKRIQSIIGHEYFHNWTGNRVTLRDWFQLSLKEGLTIYRDQTFSQDLISAAQCRIEDVKALRASQFPEDQGPMAHAVRPQSFIEINNFYTATVYNKGGEVIRMMRQILGQEGFRKGMDLYFQRHDGQAAQVEDFLNAMKDANHWDGAGFLDWYAQAGTPVLAVQEDWNPDQGFYTLHLNQQTPPTPGQTEKKPLPLPLRFGLLGPLGEALPLDAAGTTEQLHLMTQATETLQFKGMSHKPVASLLRGFSAPVKLEFSQTEAELAFLLAHDPDAFNRWEAGWKLMLTSLFALAEAAAQGRALQPPEALLNAMETLLQDPSLDDEMKAMMLQVPALGQLADERAPVALAALDQAREFLVQALAQRLQPLLQTLYPGLQAAGPYQFHGHQAGKRALANTALFYLVKQGKADWAVSQYQQATNMTLRLGALSAINESMGPERETCFADFSQRYQADALVMNHYFAFQASSRLNGAEQIQALTLAPGFEADNPNKIRSLFGVFAGRNLTQFHRADGAGYRLLANEITRLDPKNPSMSSGLARQFAKWRRYDTPRQALMQVELQKLAQGDLSKNLFEVVSRILG